MKKVWINSLGCARNLVDSETILGNFLESGFELSLDASSADILILNSCSFLKDAREESKVELLKIFCQKKEGAKVVVAGCMVESHLEELKKNFPDVDYYFSTKDLKSEIRKLSTFSYSYLKIAEGCNKRCSYCIIPDIRGPLRSKTIDQVVKEFNNLLDHAIFEVVLIAQDLGDFGKDRGERGALKSLLRALLKIDKNFWLRLLYLYPDELDDELIAIIKSDPRICPYVDMPIQHINDRILTAMKRSTSKKQIIELVNKLKGQDIVIRTSLMVGFPNESTKEFQELYDFVKEYNFTNAGIFTFSKEKEGLIDSVEESVKKERAGALKNLILSLQQQKHLSLINKQVVALVDGYHPESCLLMTARMQTQCPEVDPQIIINDISKVKTFGIPCKITIRSLSGSDLIGTPE